MAVYESGSSTGGNLTQTEVHLYGSSRLGILNTSVNVQSGNLLVGNTGNTIFTRGEQFFELSNHLQNVLVTISDKKIQHTANNVVVDYYTADVVTANDYYPFGMMMPGRNYNAQNRKDYRYGFNGKENDNDVKAVEGGQQDYGLRIYDPRLGRFLSVDPLTDDYPSWSPYPFAMNRPIDGIDLDGGEWKPVMGGEDGKTVTDYTWVGFNKDGSTPEGSVAGGSITTNGLTANFNSYFIPYFDLDGNRTGGKSGGTISYNSPSELSGGGKSVRIGLHEHGVNYSLLGGYGGNEYSMGSGTISSGENPAGNPDYSFSVGGLTEYTNRQLGANQTRIGYSFEGIESDGLGPVDYFLGAGLFRKGAGLFSRTAVNLFVSAAEKKAVQTELMIGAKGATKLLGPGLKIADNKLVQHAPQWGISQKGSSLTAEQLGKMRNLANHIYKNATTIKQGIWGNPSAGGFSNALFYSNGKHLIISESNGNMITILRNAMGNKHFNNALTIWKK